jgi:hypothetical protein
VPVTYSSKARAAERAYQTFLDWTRRVMQLAAVAVILLYGYVLYGLLFGDVGHWASLSRDAQSRIATNIHGATHYLNIALGLLLLTLCLLFYDEQSLGYTLVASSLFLYYGVPFLLSTLNPSQLTEWNRTNNQAALTIMNQLKTAALMLAIPGGVLTLRDLVLRFADGSARKNEEFTAMQYGGAVKEEAPTGAPIIGMFAKCWQLPFCRDAIRKGCPIYHARTRCWKQRVGCMCEENVIRNAMDAVISKELITITKEEPEPSDEVIQFEAKPSTPAMAAAERTAEFPKRTTAVKPPPPPGQVKIPHNPNLPMSVKRERCRNCVIYNEHQRMKYQFFAPFFVLAVPAVAFWQIEAISGALNSVLSKVDEVMAHLSLNQEAVNSGHAASITQSNPIAGYIVIGCLVVIATTWVLRGLEYAIFKLKI